MVRKKTAPTTLQTSTKMTLMALSNICANQTFL